jgi:hypothetical protein
VHIMPLTRHGSALAKRDKQAAFGAVMTDRNALQLSHRSWIRPEMIWPVS